MGSVPVDKAGVGSAVLNSMRQVGGSLGIAVMGAIVAAGVDDGAPVRRSVRSSPSSTASTTRCASAALLAFVGAIVAVATIRKTVHAQHPVAEPAAAIESA